MSALPKTYYSEQDYLELERKAEYKSEYFQGEIFAMAGASRNHNRITENLSIVIGGYLRGKSCQTFSSDLRVHIPANTLYTYPDIVIVCGKPEFLKDAALDTLLNPTAIIEVQPRSTVGYDREAKFQLYREIPSFQEYILVDSEKVHAEVWYKPDSGFWTLRQETNKAADSLYLHSIDFTLPLSDVYALTEGLLP